MQRRSRLSIGRERSDGARRYLEEVVGRFLPSRMTRSSASSSQQASMLPRGATQDDMQASSSSAASARGSAAASSTGATASSHSSRSQPSSLALSSPRLGGDEAIEGELEDCDEREGMAEEEYESESAAAGDRHMERDAEQNGQPRRGPRPKINEELERTEGEGLQDRAAPNRRMRIARLMQMRLAHGMRNREAPDEHGDDEVHPLVTCDGCGAGPPLHGPVFKCSNCDDFDFCGYCYRNRDRYGHPAGHVFVPRRPASSSASSSTTATVRAAMAAAVGRRTSERRSRPPIALLQFLEDEMLQEALRRSMEAEETETRNKQAEAAVAAVLAAVPRIKWGEPLDSASGPAMTQEDIDLVDECPMCLEEYTRGEEVLRLPCGHIFHEGCLEPWLKKSMQCPMCMQELSP